MYFSKLDVADMQNELVKAQKLNNVDKTIKRLATEYNCEESIVAAIADALSKRQIADRGCYVDLVDGTYIVKPNKAGRKPSNKAKTPVARPIASVAPALTLDKVIAAGNQKSEQPPTQLALTETDLLWCQGLCEDAKIVVKNEIEEKTKQIARLQSELQLLREKADYLEGLSLRLKK